MHNGQKFTHRDTGKTVVVLDVKPFGRVDMGQMMTGPIPSGLTGVTRQWNTTQHSVRSLIANGTYQPA